MSQETSRSAIVIGGSIAGLLAARVLADYFNHVTIIERDQLPTEAELRAGVPQGYHAHALMARGRQIMEALFPGLEADLLAHGSIQFDMAQDAQIRFKNGWAKRIFSDLPVFSMSRALLEGQVRARVLAHPRISVREGYDGLGFTAYGGAVTGVQLRPRGTQETIFLSADLVVDASGRASKTPDWLQKIGFPTPAETAIDAFVGYATRWYEIPEDAARDWQGIWVQSVPPIMPRGGIVLPIEGNRWQVTLFGIGKDYPPTDDEGFLDFAHSLATKRLYDAIKSAKPLGAVHGYRNTVNRMRHYDKLARFPEGLIVIGDAYAHFNPTYAQGMTVAALSADALAQVLKRRPGAVSGLGREFQKRAAKVLAPAWTMTTTEDLRWETTVGGTHNLMTRIMHWYTGSVLALVSEDEEVFKAFLPVQHMLKPGTALFAPSIFRKVIAYTLKQRRQPVQQTVILATQELAAVKQ